MAADHCTGGIGPSYLSDCGSSKREIKIPNPCLTETVSKGKIREIRISQLDHGYILNVGCKTIALDTPEKILFGLKRYLENPNKVENEFLKDEFRFEPVAKKKKVKR